MDLKEVTEGIRMARGLATKDESKREHVLSTEYSLKAIHAISKQANLVHHPLPPRIQILNYIIFLWPSHHIPRRPILYYCPLELELIGHIIQILNTYFKSALTHSLDHHLYARQYQNIK